MSDKPVVQFKLTVPDTDALRDMIRRDHAAAIKEAKRLSDIPVAQRSLGWSAENSIAQRDLRKIGHLADIFSVELAQR